jgi:3-oxoacyl-[acyl-carrier protein] reductase
VVPKEPPRFRDINVYDMGTTVATSPRSPTMSPLILITGGGRGIGGATALALAQRACSLILTYNQDKASAEETGEKCRKLGAPAVHIHKLDLSDLRSTLDFVDAINALDGLDVLINNAGALSAEPFAEASIESTIRMCRVNFEGPIVLSRLLLPKLRKGILTIGSVAAAAGQPRIAVYSATKAGIAMFSRMLAEQLRSERPELWVYAVHPDETSTGMSLHHGRPAEEVADLIARVVSGELRPPDVSDLGIEYLASDALPSHGGTR